MAKGKVKELKYVTYGDRDRLDRALVTEDLEFILETVDRIVHLRVREALRNRARK